MPAESTMSTRASRFAAGVVALLLMSLVVSCGRPGSSPGNTTPSGGPSDRYGAPVIAHSRDLQSRSQDPCHSLLASGQLSALGLLSPGEYRLTAQRGPTCRWHGTSPNRSFSAVVWTDEDFLVNAYRNNQSDRRFFSIFRPTTIADLPAVEQQNDTNLTSCVTTVGVAPRQALMISSDSDDVIGDKPVIEPCAAGRRVVEEIVSTLPPLR